VKSSLNVMLCYCNNVPQLVVKTVVLKNVSYRAGQGATVDEFVESRGRWPEKFGNHWFKGTFLC
jgi:hypothetical protein